MEFLGLFLFAKSLMESYGGRLSGVVHIFIILLILPSIFGNDAWQAHLTYISFVYNYTFPPSLGICALYQHHACMKEFGNLLMPCRIVLRKWYLVIKMEYTHRKPWNLMWLGCCVLDLQGSSVIFPLIRFRFRKVVARWDVYPRFEHVPSLLSGIVLFCFFLPPFFGKGKPRLVGLWFASVLFLFFFFFARGFLVTVDGWLNYPRTNKECSFSIYVV